MLRLLRLLGLLVPHPMLQANLLLENLALRHQLAALPQKISAAKVGQSLRRCCCFSCNFRWTSFRKAFRISEYRVRASGKRYRSTLLKDLTEKSDVKRPYQRERPRTLTSDVGVFVNILAENLDQSDQLMQSTDLQSIFSTFAWNRCRLSDANLMQLVVPRTIGQ